MKKPILIVMAAGMGSRYGGLKQMDPVGPDGEWILDYSVFDALRAGFERVVVILKEENLRDFREVAGRHIEKRADVQYAFQSLDRLPDGFRVPEGRVKPWGTAHATLCAAHLVDAPFAVINADDFYGETGYKRVYEALTTYPPDADGRERYYMAGYALRNTLSPTGHVARGVCEVSPEGELVDIVERTHVIDTVDGPLYTEGGGAYTAIPYESIVSMNLWGFDERFMAHIREGFPAFLTTAARENPLRAEYFLPFAVDQTLRAGSSRVTVLPTPDKWYGVTYRDDKPAVMAALRELRDAGRYPAPLWGASL